MGSDHVYGDFTSRLETAVELVINSLQRMPSDEKAKEVLTNVLFEQEISKLRDAVLQLAGDYQAITLLFDNIDKGWPATRVEEHDVKTVQHLVNVLNKVQRELTRRELDFEYLIFLHEIIRKRAHEVVPQKVVDLLLWYGFLGIPDARNRAVYIYNRDYDFKRLEAERDRLGEQLIEADVALDRVGPLRTPGLDCLLPLTAEIFLDCVAHQARLVRRFTFRLDTEPGLTRRRVANILHFARPAIAAILGRRACKANMRFATVYNAARSYSRKFGCNTRATIA